MKDQEIMPHEFDFDAVFQADDYLYFYRDSLTDERSQAEVEGIVELINLKEPMKILDLACGFGRHANRLAKLSHAVTGVDLNSDFLDIARKEAEENDIHVVYVQEDIRKIKYHASFDRVMLLFTAFGYFDDETNFLVLKNIYRALKPEGLFIFDIPNRDVFLKNIQPCYVTEIGEDLMIDRISFDPIAGRSSNQRIVIRDGVRREKPFSLRLYNANEIIDLLLGAGFKKYQFYGTWDGQPITAESRRLIIVADR